MRYLIRSLVVIIGVITLVSCNASTNHEGKKTGSSLTDTIMNAIPTPGDNEFLDSEAVIRSFFDAVNANNFDDALKCFPIVAHYHAKDITNYFNTLYMYQIQNDAPIPDIAEHNFFTVFSDYLEIWKQFRM